VLLVRRMVGFFMAEVDDADLPQRALATGQRDAFVEDPWACGRRGSSDGKVMRRQAEGRQTPDVTEASGGLRRRNVRKRMPR